MVEEKSTQVGVVAASSPSSPIEASPSIRAHENPWIRFMTWIRWYPKDMPPEEKKLVLKLDLSIFVFGCLSFFTKYLDQQSLTNAYVRLVMIAPTL